MGRFVVINLPAQIAAERLGENAGGVGRIHDDVMFKPLAADMTQELLELWHPRDCPVAERISDIEARHARKRLVVLDGESGRLEPSTQAIQVRHTEGWMRFPRRLEIRFDAKMQPHLAVLEPDPAARGEGRRFGRLSKS